MRFAIAMCLIRVAFAQDGAVVTLSGGSTPLGYTTVIEDAVNPTYICKAVSFADATSVRSRTFVAISAISKANPAVVTSTGHGLPVGARPKVTISGATGTGWVSGATTVNGTNIATRVDANTFSIPVDTSGNGTLAGTVVFTTTGPRLTMPEWAVMKMVYGTTATNSPVWIGWIGGSSKYNNKCSDGTSTSNNQQ